MRMILAACLLAGLPVVALAQNQANLDSLLEKRTLKQGEAVLPYRLMKPAAVEAGKTYPLVVFLHGAGERGDNNQAQLMHGVGDFASAANRAKYPCYLIAPQCPTRRRWVEVDWSAKTHRMPARASEPGGMVLTVLDQLCKEFPIDRSRIYLTGLSMGGYGTWDLLARKPELFAAGVPICGGGDEKQAARLVKMPIWAFHGDKDTAVRPERSRNMIAAIKKAGGNPKYTEYAGVGHNSWTQTYRDPELFAWLFVQKKN